MTGQGVEIRHSDRRPARVLLVEDTLTLAETYRSFLQAHGLDVRVELTGSGALSCLDGFSPDIVVLDINLPDMSGLEVLRSIKTRSDTIETVVITGHASVSIAVEAMREGAFDFVMKPFSAERLCVTVDNAVEHRRLEQKIRQFDEVLGKDRFENIIGQSFAMQTVYRVIQNAAPTDATVFIKGESGTGKELCAQALHSLSSRKSAKFVTLNCAAIPRDLLESEIFGHVKGAFTGAVCDRRGAALQADQGTLFLDEICEMELSLQSKLLRFLQEKAVQRVGEDKATQVDVRIICATNRDPLKEVEEGRFREDLYYRLHVVPLDLPPLRDRADDVVLIAREFLADVSREYGKAFRSFTSEAEAALRAYSWPGNIRQLQNVIRNAVVLNNGEQLDNDMLPIEIQLRERGPALQIAELPKVAEIAALPLTALQEEVEPEEDDDFSMGCPPSCCSKELESILPLDTVIRNAVETAIERCDGSIPRAAAALGVSPSTLYRRLQSWEVADQRDLLATAKEVVSIG